MDISPEIFIVLAVSIALVVTTGVALWIRAFVRKRRAYIDDIEKTNPVITNTPVDDPTELFKKRAKKGLKTRFSILNRVVYSLIAVGLALLIIIPFQNELPQALISIFVTSSAIIVGIAAKPLIENFLSGLVITASKKLNVGDTVMIEGMYGTIEDITTTHTVIKIWDWRRYLIPNREVLDQKIISYSLFDEWHWAQVEFSVSPRADLRKVREIAIGIASENSFAEDFESPSFWIMELNKDCVVCWIAAWASSPARSWELRSGIKTELVIALREHGIETHVNYQYVRTENGENQAFTSFTNS